ncbi:hypothetical protein [Aequorivita antarctica]|uniref:Lipoprotein n=1 Tax=Aequorivita antarctica TaxID=153266 RepID=A0A5C6YZR2_9FLAO|nr:hypothetical protein [Aequorivita antarctica]TXD73253.1 hypothetical protein ESU54_08940 [Aequorivita antarctica]SRX76006.1 hypothetical protein AEQU3_03004 [Aequorivita antarctica]
MKFQKITRIFLFAASMLIIGCSKSDDRPSSTDTYYLEMKMNGTAKNFNNAAVAQTALDNENLVKLIIGGTKDGLLNEGFELDIEFLENNITIGTYFQPEPNGDPNYELSAKFYNTSTNTYYNSFYYEPEEFTITISEISNSAVKGTYSGKIKNLDTQDVIIVSEGRFFVPIQD